MNFELTEVSFANKGDELMAIAAAAFVRRRFPDAEIGVPWIALASSSADRVIARRHAFASIMKIEVAKRPKLSRLSVAIGNLLPGSRRLGLMRPSESDVMLSVSGFSLGDAWGMKKAVTLLKHYQDARRRGQAIVLLPKAFGPFNTRQIVAPLRELFALSDLVLVRDRFSLGFLDEANLRGSNVELACDYTVDIAGKPSNDAHLLSGKAAIIPNARMLDRAPQSVTLTYLKDMAAAIRLIQARGVEPVFVIHQKRKDAKVAEQIMAHLGRQVAVFDVADALEIKYALGLARFAISSRFHGAVSTLSQGVPCVTYGWSHKYRGLMEDLACTELLVDSKRTRDSLLELTAAVLEETTAGRFRASLQSSSAALTKRTEAMWGKVYDAIALRSLKNGPHRRAHDT